jgi:hypothetical protein
MGFRIFLFYGFLKLIVRFGKFKFQIDKKILEQETESSSLTLPVTEVLRTCLNSELKCMEFVIQIR